MLQPAVVRQGFVGAGQRGVEIAQRVGRVGHRRRGEALAPQVVDGGVQVQGFEQQRLAVGRVATFDGDAGDVGQRLGHARRLAQFAHDRERVAEFGFAARQVTVGLLGVGQPDVAHRFAGAVAQCAGVGQHGERERAQLPGLAALIGQRAQRGAHAGAHHARLLIRRVRQQGGTAGLRLGMVAPLAPERQQCGGGAQAEGGVVLGRPVECGAQVVVVDRQTPAVGHRTQVHCRDAVAQCQLAEKRGMARPPDVALTAGLELTRCVFAQGLQQAIARFGRLGGRGTGRLRGGAIGVGHHQ